MITGEVRVGNEFEMPVGVRLMAKIGGHWYESVELHESRKFVFVECLGKRYTEDVKKVESWCPTPDIPISSDWFEERGWANTMNGYSKLIDGQGDVIEVFFLEDMDKPGVFHATMTQSEPSDIITITGRDFRTQGDVWTLLRALGSQVR